MNLEGKRVLVIGLGSSGASAARALARLGASVKVTESSASDEIHARAESLRASGVEVEIGGHDLGALDGDLAVVSPGIPPSSDVVQTLHRQEIETISEVELAWRLARCDFLAVTGTNGKTTTTTLLADMLREAGVPSVAAGNIGLPLIDAVFEIPKGGAIAVEVSSFQLESIVRFRPRVAVLLNVAEDHTDWHGSFEGYVSAKARITDNQQGDDVFIPNLEDHFAMEIAARARCEVVPFSALRVPDHKRSIGVDEDAVQWTGNYLMDVADSPLRGVAGLEDVLAASAAALTYGLDPSPVTRAIRRFRPLPHRMQVIAEIGGVTYIDDSKATNAHAALSAVRGLQDVVLIAGGRAKGMDLSALTGTVPPVVSVIALGEATEEIMSVFDGIAPVEGAASMESAVELARARSIPGGSVLLSPGCASLDMYKSYAHRGDAFARAVRAMQGSGGNV